jgi:hypothetical protein
MTSYDEYRKLKKTYTENILAETEKYKIVECITMRGPYLQDKEYAMWQKHHLGDTKRGISYKRLKNLVKAFQYEEYFEVLRQLENKEGK